MSTHVYANNNEIASKASDGKSIAAFPDVCFSPPAPPVGPMPLPYPNTGECTNTDKGTSKVFIKDKMSGMGDESCFSKSMGDESATQNFNKGMITSALQGKCYFGLWSMDVQMEGKNVPRHLDMVTHNHGSKPGGTPPNPAQIRVQIGANLEVKTVKKNECCYLIEIVDIFDEHLEISDFICREGHVENWNVFICHVQSYNDRHKALVGEDIEIHNESGVIIIFSSSDIDAMSVFCYEMFKFSNNKHEYKIINEDRILIPNSTLPIFNKKTESCSLCKGDLLKTKIQIIPNPSFPVLRFGAWDQATAYNLSIMSNVAYGDLYKTSHNSYSGSLHNIACNLSISNSVITENDYRMIVNRPLSKKNALKNINTYKYIYIKSGSAPNDFGGLTYYSILANSKQIIVAFRGTSSKIDWFIDFSVNMQSYKRTGQAHSGFLSSYIAVANSLFKDLRDIYHDQEIFVTGHSLGGAIALLFSDSLKGIYKNAKVVLYTYGMPRVFDLFAVANLNDFEHYRHVFEGDFIPRCIPTKLPPSIVIPSTFSNTTKSNIKNAAFMCAKNERSHSGYLYYIERKKLDFWDELTLGIVPSSQSRKSAVRISANMENNIYFYPQKNINLVNTEFENNLQAAKSIIISPIVGSFKDHSILKYIGALKVKLNPSIKINSENCAALGW